MFYIHLIGLLSSNSAEWSCLPKHMSGFAVIILVLVVLSFSVELAFSISQMVTVEGTLGLELFDPLCRKATPPCSQPSLSIPIIIAEGVVFLLKSNDSSMRQQLFSNIGSRVKISGIAQQFNATQKFEGYSCTPYYCDKLQSEIIVTAIYSLAASDNTTAYYSIFFLAVVVIALVSLLVYHSGRKKAPEFIRGDELRLRNSFNHLSGLSGIWSFSWWACRS